MNQTRENELTCIGRHKPRWIGLLLIFPLLIMMHLASAATPNPDLIKFDHSQTGFPLTGAHIQARCASCHVDGVYKGTPHDCASCHVAGNHMGAVFKNTTHIPTFDNCDRCHQTNAWTPIKPYDHIGVAPGTCQNCHNSKGGATGKPSGHIATTASCDSCHKTSDWKQLAAGGLMPANHLPTNQACSLCHNQANFVPGKMNHAGIVTGCSNCHNGQIFVGVTPRSKPVDHLPTNMPCELCHSSSNFTTFVIPTSPTMMNHAGIVNNCSLCHTGQTFAVGITPKQKSDAPTTHMTTSSDCSACHTSTTTFLMANLTTPPIGHLPTTQVCSTCHSAGFGPGSGVMTHTGIVSGCASCHNGQVFTGVTPKSKPVNHLPTSMPCETCHSPTSTNPGGFAGTLMKHTGIVSGCTNCHNGQSFFGVTPVSKPVGPPSHVPTSMSCETCHSSSNFVSFLIPTSPSMMNHTGIVSGCATCHGAAGVGIPFYGVTPTFQSSSHQPTGSTPCESCHSSTTSFAVATGGTKPANHLPTTAACSVCHGTPYYPGIMNHAGAGIVSGCATCHNGQVFVGVTPVSKPVNHLPTAAACETCHTAPVSTPPTPGGFAGGKMNHTGIVSGCTNCHNGQVFAGISPVSKPGTHLPTSLACETCHSTSNFITFSGTQMNHTGIVNNCTLCHNGQVFYGVTPVSKSATHIPYATTLIGGSSMQCEFCHSTSVFTSFMTGTVSSTTMHNGTTGGGACYTCHHSPNQWSATNMQTTTHNGTSVSKDCSSSGCHRPLGNTGSSYTNWGG